VTGGARKKTELAQSMGVEAKRRDAVKAVRILESFGS